MTSDHKWVILGSGNGSTNLGDEAMWEAAARFVRERFPRDRIVTDGPASWKPPVDGVEVLPNLSLDLRRGRSIRARARTKLGKLAEVGVSYPFRNRHASRVALGTSLESLPLGRLWAKEIRSSRGLIYSGAGAINDDYAVHGVYAWLMLARSAASNNTPIAMIGQGLGPLTDGRARRSAKELLSYPSIVSVRESKSFDLLAELRPEGISELTPDWALALRPSVEDERGADQAIARHIGSSQYVIVSAHRRHSTTRSQLRQAAEDIVKVVLDAKKAGAKVVFIGNMYAGRYSDDRETAKIIRSMLPIHLQNEIIIPPEVFRAGVVRSLIGKSLGIISTRYHPMVFAFGEGVPSVGLTYDDYYVQKLKGISLSFGVAGNTFPVGKFSEADRSTMDLLVEAKSSMSRADRSEEIVAPLKRFIDRVDSGQ